MNYQGHFDDNGDFKVIFIINKLMIMISNTVTMIVILTSRVIMPSVGFMIIIFDRKLSLNNFEQLKRKILMKQHWNDFKLKWNLTIIWRWSRWSSQHLKKMIILVWPLSTCPLSIDPLTITIVLLPLPSNKDTCWTNWEPYLVNVYHKYPHDVDDDDYGDDDYLNGWEWVGGRP